MSAKEQAAAMRRVRHARYVEDLREGRRLRAARVEAKRGKGSYRRKKFRDTTDD